ncbi:hypothetical protein BTVI_129966 [Pitangus sulphuratus]|nr:hypothetical protein BTVI_129966 [Pitangus sulphuratus]
MLVGIGSFSICYGSNGVNPACDPEAATAQAGALLAEKGYGEKVQVGSLLIDSIKGRGVAGWRLRLRAGEEIAHHFSGVTKARLECWFWSRRMKRHALIHSLALGHLLLIWIKAKLTPTGSRAAPVTCPAPALPSSCLPVSAIRMAEESLLSLLLPDPRESIPGQISLCSSCTEENWHPSGVAGCDKTTSLSDVQLVFDGRLALIAVMVVTAVLAASAKKSKLKNVDVEVLVGLRGGKAQQTICRERGVVCAGDSKHHDLPGGDGDFWLPF